MSKGRYIRAAELNADHIDEVITTNIKFGHAKVSALITGVVRQIYHRMDETVVYMTSSEEFIEDLDEFMVHPEQKVYVHPKGFGEQ